MIFEDILRYHQGITVLARTLLQRPAFETIHVTIPDPSIPETSFIRITSWLYCFYFETGRVSLRFLQNLGNTYNLLDINESKNHMEIVRCLRTELHHNLGFLDSDQSTRLKAEAWRRRACGTAIPRSEQEWKECYNNLINEAHTFLENIDNVIRYLEQDEENSAAYIKNWAKLLDRDWPAAMFDPLVDEVKCRLGREAVNTIEFRNRNVSRWRQLLLLLEDEFDFSYEATRLIEKSMLDDSTIVLPITGKDIILELSIKPGPIVGIILEEGRKRFCATLCNKDELIGHLKLYAEEKGFT